MAAARNSALAWFVPEPASVILAILAIAGGSACVAAAETAIACQILANARANRLTFRVLRM